MEKVNKKPVSTAKPKKPVTSQVLDTAGGEMPDASKHQGPSEKEVRYAFSKSNQLKK